MGIPLIGLNKKVMVTRHVPGLSDFCYSASSLGDSSVNDRGVVTHCYALSYSYAEESSRKEINPDLTP